jgi:hypothetical protein
MLEFGKPSGDNARLDRPQKGAPHEHNPAPDPRRPPGGDPNWARYPARVFNVSKQ